MKRLDIDQARLHAGTPFFCLFIDRPMPKEDCPDKWEGSICFAVAFIRRRILCRVLFASGRKPGTGGGFRFASTQLSAKLAAAYATICFREWQLRCADGAKAFYDLIIAATTNPQARMTTT
ncbi:MULTISPECIES: hypothetical protein [Agrobacterium]|uniref:hypothetical protein n=1 Tax=Agrobacterium TaxID=357 RepID=UPI001178B254|nr:MULTISPECIES: hypothetical protein [Agrobacterium]